MDPAQFGRNSVSTVDRLDWRSAMPARPALRADRGASRPRPRLFHVLDNPKLPPTESPSARGRRVETEQKARLYGSQRIPHATSTHGVSSGAVGGTPGGQLGWL